MPPLWCYSANIILVRSATEQPAHLEELRIAVRFYGLGLTEIAATDTNFHIIGKAIARNETIAVAVTADALGLISDKALMRFLPRRSGARVPMLILNVTPETNPSLLRMWSRGAVVACKRLHNQLNPNQVNLSHYVIGRAASITGELGGMEMPFPSKDASYLVLGEDSSSQTIAAVRNGQQILPTFIAATQGQKKVFLWTKSHSSSSSGINENPDLALETFASIAPALMFVKYAAGERGWHTTRHYANLTIDDPWLRERYGNLCYKDLLGEMEKHRFHTTIAFVPWNYARSESGVASLFKNHPERFSICIHGNNHDHQEFGDLRSKSLDLQTAAIRESLNRMERFQQLTGIPYDKVMVFPHNIGSQSILQTLKTYNFLATVNASNVPMDNTIPLGQSFVLRTVTLFFAGFPSVRRYPAYKPDPSYIAINAFLDNPLLFYCHSDLFSGGIGAFNTIADQVNSFVPDIRWSSLGDVIRHLYLVRVRDDSNHDVLSFTHHLSLDNTSDRDSVFYVRIPATGLPAIASVTIDGQPCLYQLDDRYLNCRIGISAGRTRNLVVLFANDLHQSRTNESRYNLRIWFLRTASDFRDIVLSQFTLGRALTDFYYKRKITPLLIVTSAIATMTCWGCMYLALRVIRRKIKCREE